MLLMKFEILGLAIDAVGSLPRSLCITASARVEIWSGSEDLVHASLSFSKACLVLTELLVHSFRDPPDDELG